MKRNYVPDSLHSPKCIMLSLVHHSSIFGTEFGGSSSGQTLVTRRQKHASSNTERNARNAADLYPETVIITLLFSISLFKLCRNIFCLSMLDFAFGVYVHSLDFGSIAKCYFCSADENYKNWGNAAFSRD